MARVRRLKLRLALVLVFASHAPAQLGQNLPFKSTVSVVEVDVAVAGKEGPIDGLQLADFAVQDNRKPVTLRYASQDESPLDVVFLFELSKLMMPKLLQVRTAAEMAMAELRDADRVAVMSFNQETRMEQPLTADFKAAKVAVRNGLAGAVFGGKAFILPAADAAANYLSKFPEPHGRRIVVIFTGDAGAGLNDQSHARVAQDFWEADASLSAMVIPNVLTRILHDADPSHFGAVHQLGLAFGFSVQDTIDDVAELTGGEVVYSADVGDIRKEDNPYASSHGTSSPNASLREVMRQTRRRYRLYYDLPAGNPGQRRQIHVELSPGANAVHSGARIIGRKGYMMPKAGAQ
jgi:VWFA-related protein